MTSAPSLRIWLMAAVTMTAFAANSLLCRLALRETAIDPASFTLVRIATGALVLALLVALRQGRRKPAGDWRSAAALLGYAAAFSFAYVELSAGTGALLLFGAVQVTMIGRGLVHGDRFRPRQLAGLGLAVAGLVTLLLPGLTAPPPLPAGLMLAAGVCWGIYSLLGRGNADPMGATAGNFLRAAPISAVLAAVAWALAGAQLDALGLLYATVSGAAASGLGYALWYATLPSLSASRAGVLQLSVPVLTALFAVPLLGETISLRLLAASAAVLGGIALVIVERRRRPL